MINQCTIVGRLVADPESRQTQGGKSVCSIRVAVDRKGREKETDFFSCTAFGQQGDALAEYAQKEARRPASALVLGLGAGGFKLAPVVRL